MEKMYNDFKDVAEFRMVYIREAHADDGERPTRGRSLGINEHKNFTDRCETAQRFIDDKSLTIPMLIDNMDNSTDTAYSAKPDRVFLVRTDGRLGVAGAQGPFGFTPGLEACEKWLKEFKKDGEQALTQEVIDTADKKTEARKSAMAKAKSAEATGLQKPPQHQPTRRPENSQTKKK